MQQPQTKINSKFGRMKKDELLKVDCRERLWVASEQEVPCLNNRDMPSTEFNLIQGALMTRTHTLYTHHSSLNNRYRGILRSQVVGIGSIRTTKYHIQHRCIMRGNVVRVKSV